MNKSLNSIVTVFAIIFVVFQVRHIFSAGTPADYTHTVSKSYITTSGDEVSISDYFGDYLWVDYAAEWCSYCAPQTRTLKGLENRYGEQVTFLTVVAGTDTVMEPPSADTAANWARRFDLDTDRVLAYFSTKRLPYHILYSPDGKVLFEGSGLYDAGRIMNVLNKHTTLIH